MLISNLTVRVETVKQELLRRIVANPETVSTANKLDSLVLAGTSQKAGVLYWIFMARNAEIDNLDS